MTIPKGLSAFPITPADAAGRVDEAALRKLITRLAQARVDSIGLLGSTGTYMYLTREARRRALEVALEEAGGTPVIVSVGALRTDDAVRIAQDARAAGAAAGLMPAVSYNPLTEDEVFTHFTTVARESGLPLVIYDNPVATHFQFTEQLLRRLAAEPGIVAIKNSSAAPDRRAWFPPAFSVGCSGDWVCTEALLGGQDVWYSVLGGVLPKTCLRIVRAAQQGDAAEARRVNAALAPLWDLFKQHGGLRAVYALADILGLCRAAPPKPILPVAPSVKQRIADVLREMPAGIVQD